MTTAAPNWYPDPSNPNTQRWWDGLQWTAHTRNILTPPVGEPVTYVPFATQPQYAPAGYSSTKRVAGTTFLLRRNVPGFIGVALAVGSFLFDLFLIVGIAGLVLSIIGLVRDSQLRAAGNVRTGRGWLIAGIILGTILIVFHAAVIVNALSFFA